MAKKSKNIHPTRVRKTIKDGKLEEEAEVVAPETEEKPEKVTTKSKEAKEDTTTIELEDDDDGVGDEDEDEGSDEDSEDEGDEDDEDEDEDEDDEEVEAESEPEGEEVLDATDAEVIETAPVTEVPGGNAAVDVPAGTVSQVAAAPFPLPTSGPINIDQLAASSIQAVTQIVTDIHNALVSDGKDNDTTRKYGIYAKKFFAYIIQQGMKLESMPSDALYKYVLRWENPATQNVYMNSINSFIKKANEIGIPMTPQVFTLNKLIPGPGRGVRHAMPDPNLPSGTPVPFEQQPQVQHRQPRAAQMTQPYNNGARPTTVDGLPIGGKVVIYKQALGNEMPGIAPGQLIHIGTYPPSVVANDGDVASFIQRWVVPRFGPFAGGNDMTYVIQRLDDRGNKTRIDESLSIAAPIGQGEFTNSPGAPRPIAPVAPVAPAAPTDKVVDMLNRQLELLAGRYEAAQAKLMDGKGGGNGSDPMAAIALMDAKREADEIRRDIENLRKERDEKERRALQPPPQAFAPPPAHGGGLGGLFDPPPPQNNGMDKMIEVFGALMTTLLATKIAPPPPPTPAPVPVRDPMMEKMWELMMAKMMKGETDPAITSVMQEIRDMKVRMEKPDKSKDFAETLGNIKEAMGLVNMLNGGGERPSAVVELVEALAPHMDKLGSAVGNIVGAFAGKPPQLPAHNSQPNPTPAPGPQPNGKRPVLPEGIKAAMAKMVSAPPGEDQQVVDGLYEMVRIFQSNPEWTQAAQVIGNRFMNAESKPEIRSLVTNMMLICGEKKFASDEKAIERVTQALHSNYSFLFSVMSNGQQKKLIDAEPEEPVEELQDEEDAEIEAAPEAAPEATPDKKANGVVSGTVPGVVVETVAVPSGPEVTHE